MNSERAPPLQAKLMKPFYEHCRRAHEQRESVPNFGDDIEVSAAKPVEPTAEEKKEKAARAAVAEEKRKAEAAVQQAKVPGGAVASAPAAIPTAGRAEQMSFGRLVVRRVHRRRSGSELRRQPG